MKKIPSLFQRNYDGDRLVRDEVVPGSEWVLEGEGRPTAKIDGTACMIRAGRLFKRYDRKKGKTAPEGWEPCEAEPNEHTGHWPGWVPVGDGPEDKWYREASLRGLPVNYCTCELVGPKVQGNPYKLVSHQLLVHGWVSIDGNPRDFESIRGFLESKPGIEGIVWYHQDGRMVKIKRKDFGLPWPPKKEVAK